METSFLLKFPHVHSPINSPFPFRDKNMTLTACELFQTYPAHNLQRLHFLFNRLMFKKCLIQVKSLFLDQPLTDAGLRLNLRSLQLIARMLDQVSYLNKPAASVLNKWQTNIPLRKVIVSCRFKLCFTNGSFYLNFQFKS